MKKVIIFLFSAVLVGVLIIGMWPPTMERGAWLEKKKADILRCWEDSVIDKNKKTICQERQGWLEKQEKREERIRPILLERMQEMEEEIAGRPLSKETAKAYESLIYNAVSLDESNCAKYMDTLKEILKYTDAQWELERCYSYFGDDYNALLISLQEYYPPAPDNIDANIECSLFLKSPYYTSSGFIRQKLILRKLKNLCPEKLWKDRAFDEELESLSSPGIFVKMILMLGS